MNFEQHFEEWLSKGLQTDIPDEVKAYAFNLYEVAAEEGVKFGIELIGAGEFDPEDADWACDEIWEPHQRQLLIPIEYSGESWDVCHERMKKLALTTLNSDEPLIQKLKATKGVGIGFVDGDLELIWLSE